MTTHKTRKIDLDNGYFAFANELADELASLRASGCELALVLLIARRTYGSVDPHSGHADAIKRKQTTVALSISEAARATRWSEHEVARSLRRLVAAKVLACKQIIGQPGIYGINPYVGMWDRSVFWTRASAITGLSVEDLLGSPAETPALEKPKRTRTAKAPAGDKTPAPTRQVLDTYGETWAERYGVKPVISWGRDGKIAKDLLAAAGGDVDRAVSVVRAYLADNDPWLVDKSHPWPTVMSRVNRYLAALAKSHPSSSAPAGVSNSTKSSSGTSNVTDLNDVLARLRARQMQSQQQTETATTAEVEW